MLRNKTEIGLLMVVVAVFLCTSCVGLTSQRETSLDNPDDYSKRLRFESRQAFDRTIELGLNEDSDGKRLKENLTSRVTHLRGMNDDEVQDWSDLVPEKAFFNLLNSKGEIQVGDTIYAINERGTFYAHYRDYDEMVHVISSGQDYAKWHLQGRLYRIGNVYRYDTFGTSLMAVERVLPQEPESIEVMRSDLPEPDIRLFERVPGKRHTAVGKFFQGLSVRYSHTIALGGTNNRRLNCAMFDYNYVIRQAIGISAKVEQKMWYGAWAKVRSWGSGEIRCGFTSLVLRYPYPSGSGYDEIYTRIFKVVGRPEIRPTSSPGVVLGGDPNYMNLHYNRDTQAVDVSIFPMVDSSKPTPEQINTAVGMFAKAVYYKLKGAYSTTGHYSFESKDAFDPSSRYDRPSVTEVLSVINAPVTVFGRDGIYVAYPPIFNSNDSGENAIFTRPFYSYAQEGKITLTGNLGSSLNFNNIYNHIKLDFGNPDVSIVQGEGYACGYHRYTGWSGFRLYW